LDGPSLEKGAEIRVTPRPDGSGDVSFVSPYFGDGLEISGRVSPSDGASQPKSIVPLREETGSSYEIEFEELRYFGNWQRGWTEAVFPVTGSIRISFDGEFWRGRVLEKPTIGPAKTAKLRYMDSYLSGEQAVEAVRNRAERIEAAIAVWRDHDETWFERPVREKGLFKRSPKGQSFSETVGPVFFPEVYGYGNGSWSEGPWVRGDGRKWDAGYTRSRFPDHLWEVRDSGTLYRDWEEGFPLWYLTAQWSSFWEYKLKSGNISILQIDGETK
jgi:hypothetical protein